MSEDRRGSLSLDILGDLGKERLDLKKEIESLCTQLTISGARVKKLESMLHATILHMKNHGLSGVIGPIENVLAEKSGGK